MARYMMRQRLVSIGEDFDIADENGNPVFRVDGKVMRLRDNLVLEDLQGREVATIREKKLALRESMNILREGSNIATVRKARFARRYDMPDGSIMHAEVQIDDTVVMIANGGGDNPAFPIWLHIYVPDVDATYRRALDAGGLSVDEPKQREGDPDRRAGVKDPAGNTW
jgi:uncharacterized glyoxalase superfamily protein PhnB